MGFGLVLGFEFLVGFCISGFGVWFLGFEFVLWVLGSWGFGVWGLGFGVWGLGFWVLSFAF
jgi:hypothetical protein